MTRFRLESVSVAFGDQQALTEVSLDVEPGECVGLVGPSGAGKTTLLRLLVGAERASAGRIQVDGRDLASLGDAELRAVRAGTGFVHQDLRLVPGQRVLANVLAGRLGRWSFLRSLRELLWPRRAEVERVHAWLERTGIPDKLYQPVDRLSGGEQQRVAIARALYQQPASLLADEPVSSVDPARAADVLELLRRIAAEEGLTLVVSLHDVALARRFLPRLVGLRDGRVAFDRPAKELSDADFEALYRLEGPGAGG